MEASQLVLIGDIIQSRKGFNPQQWKLFHQAIESLNRDFEKELTTPLVVYSGDSFGAIVKNVNTAVTLSLKLQERISPLKVRIVLIEDEVSYGLESRNFLELEGPALWKSPDRMKELKENGSYFRADIKDQYLSFSLNASLNLILAVKYDWDEIEWEIYRQYPEHKTQKEIARQKGVSQQYISKLIRQSKFKLVKQSEKNLILLSNGNYAPLGQ